MHAGGAVVVVGREKELDALTACFTDGARLITLVGPGGIGKTTLASHYARCRVSADGILSGGVAMRVDLDGARSIPELVDRIAAVLPSPAPSSPNDTSDARLASVGPGVLVLDDFDALVPFALETVGAWMDRCVELEILVTSRERLGIAGENVFEVGPLTDLTAVGGQSPAVALLLSAARRAAVGYVSPPNDAPLLAEIVTQLEGVPLALELAGARLPLVGAHGLVTELRAGVPLRSASIGRPERHASIDAAVRGSYAALSPQEKDVLAQLTVFRGGFTAESVRGIVALPAAMDAVAMLDVLRSRSLVRTHDSGAGAARFDLYAQVRDFVVAVESRAASPAIGLAAERHASFFATQAERVAHAAHTDPTARTWLVVERENVIEVVRRVLTVAGSGSGSASASRPPNAERAELALRAIMAAKEVLFAHGPSAEISELVSPLVERTRDSGADPKLTARVMLLRGALRRDKGADLRASLKDLLSAESIARAMRDAVLGAEASVELGKTVRAAGELEAAKQNFDRGARAFAHAGMRVREAEALALLGATAAEACAPFGNAPFGSARYVNYIADLATARSLCERAQALAGDDRLLGGTLHLILARVQAESGDRSSARRSAEAALERSADNDPRTAARALVLLGLLLHEAGDLPNATQLFERARDDGATDETDAAIAVGHLGAIAREQGRAAEAYAALAEARDAAIRAKKHAHATYFSAHLSAIELTATRHEAATDLLASCDATTREADPWWPISVTEVVTLQRAALKTNAPSAPAIPAAAAPAPAPAPASGSGPASGSTTPRSLLARVFARCSAAHPILQESLPSEGALLVGANGSWFRPPYSPRVGLERRRSLALLLDRLATERLAHPRSPLRASDLFAAAWPGEKAIVSAAAHRVRVAIATLRKMGLRDAVITTPDGYCLSADVDLERV